MKITTALLIASPFVAIGLGTVAFYRHWDINWSSYGGGAFTLGVLAEAVGDRISKSNRWKAWHEAASLWCMEIMTIFYLAGLTQAIEANPADWLNICLKNWWLTVLPVAGIVLLVLFGVLGEVRPNSMRSGRKVPLTPFLDRK